MNESRPASATIFEAANDATLEVALMNDSRLLWKVGSVVAKVMTSKGASCFVTKGPLGKLRSVAYPRRDLWPIRLLAIFQWCCTGESRDIVRVMMRDFRTDEREMRGYGWRGLSIGAVLGIRVFLSAILPLLFDGIVAFFRRDERRVLLNQ